jgi:hypothetical protein
VTGHFVVGCYFDSYTLWGEPDVFVARYDPNGMIQWVTKGNCSAGSSAYGTDIAVNNTGQIFVTGTFNGTLDLQASPVTTSYKSMFTTMLNFNEKVGIAENSELKPYKFYPNPSSGNVTLEVDENFAIKKIILSTTQGREVRKLTNTANENIVLDFSSLSKGIYLLEVQTSGKTYYDKIVIE